MELHQRDSTELDSADTNQAEPVDVLVIGAGMAGLSAAVAAASNGASVLVIDSRTTPGGRARTDEHEGFRRNQGPRALYLGGEAMATLARFGIEPTGNRPSLNGLMVDARGTAHQLPVGPAALAKTSGLSAREKVRFGLLYRKLLTCTDTSISVSAWLDNESVSGRVRGVLEMLIRLSTYAADTDRISAAATGHQLGLGGQGVRYVDGGWQSITSALMICAQSKGVQNEFGIAASSVQRLPNGNLQTTLRNGDHRTSQTVVFAGLSPTAVAELSTDAHLAAVAKSAHPAIAACLDLCLKKLPRPDIRIALGSHRPWYLSCHTPAADLAPPTGGEVVHVMKYVPADELSHSPEDDRRELEAFADMAQPGWRDELIDARYLHRMVVTHDLPRPGTGRAMVAMASEATFVCGDWVGVSQLADAAISSGAEAGVAAATASRRTSSVR
jgi:phytoene dehydrogenase-like protein